MYKPAILALALITSPAISQQNLNSTSGSNSNASSGSISGAQSNNANSANNNIGNSTSNSNSNAGAYSGSVSGASSNGNSQGQGQGQTQSSYNGQSQGQSANNSQGQSATQANGQATTLTFNSHAPNHVEVKTNTPIGLTASSSFSSDYCGGTASGGASAAPIGISIGMSGPRYDKSCQALRRAEKFGMAAANAQNMGQAELAQKLMSMMIWSICTSDSDGPSAWESTAQACTVEGLLVQTPSLRSSAAPPPMPAAQPRTADAKGNVTPEAAARSMQFGNNERLAAASAPH